MEKVWFYKKGQQKEGPVSREELQGMLENKEIDTSTFVWTESLGDWVVISELEHFNMNTLDAAPSVSSKKVVEYERETDDELGKPRPWVRYWARMIDYSLFFLIIGYISSVFQLKLSPIRPFFGLILVFLWVFIEAILLSIFGKTPGKWLLRVEVKDKEQNRLSFAHSLNRSFSVWWLGMGAGIPIIAFITMIVAAVKLSNTGITSWDKRNRYRVNHGKIGAVRTLVTIVYFCFYLWIIYWGQVQLVQSGIQSS